MMKIGSLMKVSHTYTNPVLPTNTFSHFHAQEISSPQKKKTKIHIFAYPEAAYYTQIGIIFFCKKQNL